MSISDCRQPTLLDAAARWVDTTMRQPELLDELGAPLRCFHRDDGYYLACYVPERGWYWNDGVLPRCPDRWAIPARRPSRSTPERRHRA